jgi:hypothetical protein
MIAKIKKTIKQTMAYKTLHKEIKTKQHEAYKKQNSGAPERWASNIKHIRSRTQVLRKGGPAT